MANSATQEILRSITRRVFDTRVISCLLLTALSLALAVPAQAQLQNSSSQQTKAYHKAARKAQKNMEKYTRQQQKAMKKSAKEQQKTLKKMQQRGWTAGGWQR